MVECFQAVETSWLLGVLQLVQATQVHSFWHPLKEACHSLEHQHQGSDALYCLHRHPHTGDIAHTHIPIKENKSLRSVSQVAVFGNHYSSFQTPFSSASVPIYQSERPIRRLYSPVGDPHPGWTTGPWFSLSISSSKGNVCRSAHLQKSSMSQSLC